jgi:NAD+ kinase
VSHIVPWLHNAGVDVVVDRESALEYALSCAVCSPEEVPMRADVVAAFGGDGTMLFAARLVADSGIPIIGINLGSLGFLTEVKVEQMQLAFGQLIAGEYTLEHRMLLQIEVSKPDSPVVRHLALNDAVINKGALARIIELEVTANGDLVTMIRADGLIVSSPTGSTAYSLSAGGPILHPTLGAFIVTPICPHTLTNRPVVIPDSTDIGICLHRGSDVMLTVDGQVGIPIEPGDQVTVRKAAPSIRLVQATGTTFFRVLREKLKWG